MVDRYSFNSAGEESVSDDGGYVTYGDYAYMQTTAHDQNELYIKASMESTKTTLLLGSLHKRIAELEKQRDGLVAENAELKGFGDKLLDMYKGLDMSGGGIYDSQSITYQQAALDAAMSAFEEIKPQATGAAIAELGARAVEEFAIYFAYEISELPEDDLLESAANYANKLRRGGV